MALVNLKRSDALLAALLQESPARPEATAPPAWQLQQDLGHVRYVRSLFGGDRGNDPAEQIALARQADDLLVQALSGAEAAGAPPAQQGELHVTLLGARLSRAFGLRFLDRHAEAGVLQASEEQRMNALPAPVLATIDADFHLGRAPMQLGDALYYQDRLDDALAAYQRALSRFEAGLARRPNHRKLMEGVQIGLWNVAGTLGELKRYPEELQTIERALPLSDQLVALDPQNTNLQHTRGVIRDHYAIALTNNRRWAEALPILRANHAQRAALAQADPNNGDKARTALLTLRSIARVHRGLGDAASECRTLNATLAGWGDLERRFGLSPADVKTDVAPTRERLAEAGCGQSAD